MSKWLRMQLGPIDVLDEKILAGVLLKLIYNE